MLFILLKCSVYTLQPFSIILIKRFILNKRPNNQVVTTGIDLKHANASLMLITTRKYIHGSKRYSTFKVMNQIKIFTVMDST